MIINNIILIMEFRAIFKYDCLSDEVFHKLNELNKIEMNYIEEGSINDSYLQLEHQIGRFNSIKKVFEYIKYNNISGDILEYGIWQGHSMYNCLYLLEKIGIFNKKIIGIDGFIGIPMEYGHPHQAGGMFADTSEELVLSNLRKFEDKLYKNQKNNYKILKALYNEKNKITDYFNENNIKTICFIHLDCDVVGSCDEALTLLFQLNLLNDIFFLHFDDWGLLTGIPVWFDSFIKNKCKDWRIEELYVTRLTKTFKFSRI